MSFQIARATFGPFDTNTYLLIDDAAKRCAIVDAPPDSADLLIAEMRKRGLALEALLLTHGHWDHMADAHKLVAAGDAAGNAAGNADAPNVFAHRADELCYTHPEKYAPWYRASLPELTEADFQPVNVTNWVADGDRFTILETEFEVRHVPGHCPGNVLFYCPSRELAFPGDAIFQGSVGRSDLPGGDWRILERSIRERIYTLPDDTVLYPGHGEPTTVRDEKHSNPYVRVSPPASNQH